MPNKNSGLSAVTKIKPSVALITMAAVAAIFAIFVYFARAGSINCSSKPVAMGAGDSCTIQSEGGEVAFAYAASGAFSYEVALNGNVYKSGSGANQDTGCTKTVSSEGGVYTFTVTSGSAQVAGGTCSINGSTAPSGSLSCVAEGRRAIKWRSAWRNVSDHALLTRGDRTLKQLNGTSGLDSYIERGFKPGSKHSAVLKSKAGIVLDSATCRTKS